MTNNKTVKERLKYFISTLNISEREFEEKCNLSYGYIYSIKKGIGQNKLDEISNIYPNLNLGWLTLGDGEMLKADNPATELATNDKYKLVPLYNMDAMGGFGSNDEVDCAEYITDHIPFKDAKEKDICMPISGKSMMPTYCPGTVVLLHEIENWFEFLETGQIYVLVLKDGRRLLKELRRSQEDRNTNYLCVSHNPDYEPVELPKKLIFKVYMVTAMYQKTTI